MLPTLIRGGTVHMMKGFDPQAVLATIARDLQPKDARLQSAETVHTGRGIVAIQQLLQEVVQLRGSWLAAFLERVPEYHLTCRKLEWNSSSNFRSPVALPFATR